MCFACGALLCYLPSRQVPFPRMHFLLSSLAPLAAPRDVAALTAPRSIDQVRQERAECCIQSTCCAPGCTVQLATAQPACRHMAPPPWNQQLARLPLFTLAVPLTCCQTLPHILRVFATCLQLFGDAFSRDSQLLSADPLQHTHLAAALMMRGRLSLSDAQRNIGRLKPQLRMAHWNTEVGREGTSVGTARGKEHDQSLSGRGGADSHARTVHWFLLLG